MHYIRKITKFTLCCVSLCLISILICAAASAEQVLYYDVSAYINNYPIPCYSVNNYCAVFVKDLRNYGFKVDYSEETHSVNITRDSTISYITGMENVKLPYHLNNTYYADTGYSDITVYLSGSETPSYWANGNMMILLDHMYPFGSVDWDGEKNSLFLTIPDLPKTEYAPLEKESIPYRYMASMHELNLDSYENLPNELVAWGFMNREGTEPLLESWQISMIEKYRGYYLDPQRPKAIYLTFDEGYEAGYSQKILDVLSAYNVPAAFFITGEYLNEAPDMVWQMIQRGFIVGNHSHSHNALANRSAYDIALDLQTLNDRIKNDFGYTMHYMRPPSGEFSEKALAIGNDMGFNNIMWSFGYFDYDGNVVHGSQYALDTMKKYLHNGAIYLLHTMTADNADALESFIIYAREMGYEFRSLDELCYR